MKRRNKKRRYLKRYNQEFKLQFQKEAYKSLMILYSIKSKKKMK
jgi:hypothetical protein